MDIKILDSWLRDYLDTKATPAEIAKYVSLCGPSIEKVEKLESDYLYHIEITTNRIDSVSVYGIARESAAILPRFGIPAKLKTIRSESKEYVFSKSVSYLKADVNPNLCPRFTAVQIKDIKLGESPEIVKKRLKASGVRPINNVVDVSNYIMLELGQPIHTFDYDKIAGAKMLLRESKKGETITTLDDKNFSLPGGDIVIEDGEGKLIDLAGIMGGKASEIDESTKNVLLFVQTYNPINIRKTSMYLSQRTMAAAIFEKDSDTELVAPAILEAIDLLKEFTGGKVPKDILNIYPKPYKSTSVKITTEYIKSHLGIDLPKKDITKYLQSLGFESVWSGSTLEAIVPSFRAKDIKNSEDILEEIARIYGYHNLSSQIMEGAIPERPADPKFTFEENIKNILTGFGGSEVYTLALVTKDWVDAKSIKLKNPLGPETEHMRTSLLPSLINAAKENMGLVDKFQLFEIANIYLPRTNDLPEERIILGGVFFGYDYRQAKGVVEALLERLNINGVFKAEESKGFGASKCAFIYNKDKYLGKIGVVENSNLIYYEFELLKLFDPSKVSSFKPIPKYPAQIEDITFSIPEKTKIGDVLNLINSVSHLVDRVELKDIYKDAYTFRIWYQDSKKTLTNEDVEKIRKTITSSVKSKFGANLKD